MKFKDFLQYDPKTGDLTKKVGHKNAYGYSKFHHKGKAYYCHRVAWELHYGKPPQYTIDHINNDRSDNRIENLRDVPLGENLRNRRRKPKYLPGVSFFANCGKFRARISINKKVVCLGFFDTELEAHEEYVRQKKIRELDTLDRLKVK